MEPDQDVVEDRIIPEDAGALKGPHEPERGDFERLQSNERDAATGDSPVGGAKVPGDRIERRGLAGAIRSDQAHYLAFAHGE